MSKKIEKPDKNPRFYQLEKLLRIFIVAVTMTGVNEENDEVVNNDVGEQRQGVWRGQERHKRKKQKSFTDEQPGKDARRHMRRTHDSGRGNGRK